MSYTELLLMGSTPRVSPELIADRFLPEPESSRKGNFGEVLACFDQRTGRRVALKIALADADGRSLARAPGEDTFESIRHESAVLSLLRHPNIVELVADGVWQGRPYIALEYLAGENLYNLAARGSSISLADRVAILNQAAQALEAVHAAGLVHLDIKPENFVCCPDGRAVMIDFGSVRRPSDARVPGFGQAVTPPYSAPEQFAVSGNRWVTGEVTPAADVFAFAVFALEFLTGLHPFGGDDQGVGTRIVNDPLAVRVDEVLQVAPEEFRRDLTSCFQKKSGFRPRISRIRERLDDWCLRLDEDEALAAVKNNILSGEFAKAGEDWLAHARLHSCQKPAAAVGILDSVVEAAIRRRDAGQARQLLESIDEGFLVGEAHERWKEFQLSLRRIEDGVQKIPLLVERLRVLAAENQWRSHSLILNQAVEIDPGHPDLVAYRLGLMESELDAADELWESGDYSAAVARFRETEERYRDLMPWSGKAAERLKSLMTRWQMAAEDGFRIRSRLKDSKGVDALFAIFRGLLDFDPQFEHKVRETLAIIQLSATDRPVKLTADIEEMMRLGKLVDAARLLQKARAECGPDPRWDDLEKLIRETRENVLRQEAKALASASEVRAAIGAGNFSRARSALESGKTLMPNWPLWNDLKRELERKDP